MQNHKNKSIISSQNVLKMRCVTSLPVLPILKNTGGNSY